jgi:hypothetical protein
MNRVLYLLFLICWTTLAYSQQNYFIDNARWVYQTEESSEPGQINFYSGLEENIILGDTVLNGIPYKKLYKRFKHTKTVRPPLPNQESTIISYESKGPMFIRYETSNNKVYFKESADSSEVVIYDFNIGLGDKIPLKSAYFQANTIKRIDTISVFGINQALLVLDTLFTPIRNGIINGVGSLNGLTFYQPTFEAVSGGILMTEMVCFEYDNNTFKSPWAEQYQFPCPSLSEFISSSNDVGIELVNIFPNPNSGNFFIQIPENYIGSTFTLYNLNGQFNQSFTIQDIKNEVTLDAQGLYFYTIKGKANIGLSGKILVAD